MNTGFVTSAEGADEPAQRERLLAMGLAGGRLAIGAAIWLAPGPAFKALGLDSPSTAQALAIARIAGTRDLVLGAWQASSLGDRRRLAAATTAVAVCDAGDALAFALLLAAGERRAGLRGLAGAMPATLLGAVAVRALRREAPEVGSRHG